MTTKLFFNQLQIPLGLKSTDTGDLQQVMVFLDERSSAGLSTFLSDVFSCFSREPYAWSGGRFARSISSLFADHMISCVMDGYIFLHHHSSIFLEDPDQWAQIRAIPRKRLPPDELKEIVALFQTIFGMDCPVDQDDLTRFITGCLNRWKSSLTVFGSLAEARRYPGSSDIGSCLSFIQAWLATADPFEKISFICNGKASLCSFYDIFVRLKDFYESKTSRWESWRKSLEKFSEYESFLEKDGEVASDLSKLHLVLDMEHPWNEVDGIDTLIARIKPSYERIHSEKYALLQQDTLLQIDQMIETISQLLENVHARSEVRNMALVELQKIKKSIKGDKPDIQIFYKREIAEEAFENAQDIVLSHS